MGKILATLRKNGFLESAPTAPNPAPSCAAEPDEAIGGEGVPFIEIGPRRSVEASPDVLAAVPVRPSAPEKHTPSVLPRPHGVLFRNLPRSGPDLAPELVAYHAPGQPAAMQYGELLSALLDAAQKRNGANQALLFTT